MKSFALVFGIASLIATTAGFPAHASLHIYTSKSEFLTATSSTDVTGALPNLGFRGTTPITLGSIRIGGVSPFWVGAKGSGVTSDWTTLLPGNDIAFDGKEQFNVVTAAPVYALGFDVVEPSFGGWSDGCGTVVCIDSTFNVTLLNSAGAVVDSFTFNPPNDVAAFIGVSSTSPFTTLQVREIIGGIENEYFGHFYTSGAAPVAAVSEPGQGALLLCGLAAVAGIARRRQPMA